MDNIETVKGNYIVGIDNYYILLYFFKPNLRG